MFRRILNVTFCLSLLLPAAGVLQADSRLTSRDEAKPAGPGTTTASHDATDRSEPPAPAAESQAAKTATQAEPAAKPASPQPLSREEAASLSARAEQPSPEVAGGALSNLHLTYIVIALAAILLVLLIK